MFCFAMKVKVILHGACILEQAGLAAHVALTSLNQIAAPGRLTCVEASVS